MQVQVPEKVVQLAAVSREMLSEVYRSFRGVLPTAAQSLLDRLTLWLKESQAGRITIGLVAFLFARPIVDRAWRLLRRYPPGTIGLIPVLSTLKSVSSLDHRFLLNQPKIGPISMHYAGNTQFVLLNSVKAMEDAYMEADLEDRQFPMTAQESRDLEERFRSVIGVTPFVANDGPNAWWDRRKLLNKSLLSLLDSRFMESKVGGRMQNVLFPKLMKGISESNDGTFIWNDLRPDMSRSTFNTIFQTTFGSEFHPSDQELEEFSECVLGFGQIFIPIVLARKLPSFMQTLSVKMMTNEEQRGYFRRIDRFLRDWLDRYKSESLGETVHKLYADAMIEAIQDDTINMDEIIADISAVFFAGVHSTAATMEQAILYLVRKPHIQERLHSDLINAFPNATFEINATSRVPGSAGTEEGITLKGILQVHSLRAFVFEIQRLATALPLTLSRTVRKTFESEGFTIAEGSIVFGNLYAIGRDSQVWGDDANDFSLDRWLMMDESEMKLDKSKLDHLVTFGMGRRSCPGKQMADRQILLVLAFLLRFFKIDSPTDDHNDAPILTIEQQLQNTTSFPVRVVRRSE